MRTAAASLRDNEDAVCSDKDHVPPSLVRGPERCQGLAKVWCRPGRSPQPGRLHRMPDEPPARCTTLQTPPPVLALLPLLALLAALPLVVQAKPQQREENAVLPAGAVIVAPPATRPALRASPHAAVQEMMMEVSRSGDRLAAARSRGRFLHAK